MKLSLEAKMVGKADKLDLSKACAYVRAGTLSLYVPFDEDGIDLKLGFAGPLAEVEVVRYGLHDLAHPSNVLGYFPIPGDQEGATFLTRDGTLNIRINPEDFRPQVSETERAAS